MLFVGGLEFIETGLVIALVGVLFGVEPTDIDGVGLVDLVALVFVF